MHEALRSIYEAVGYDTAVLVRDQIAGRFLASAPKAVEVLEEGFEDVTAVLSIPLSLRRRLKTTSDLERVKKEIRRRERVIRIFPNEAPLHRLAGVLLMEIHEGWQLGRMYLSLSEYLS